MTFGFTKPETKPEKPTPKIFYIEDIEIAKRVAVQEYITNQRASANLKTSYDFVFDFNSSIVKAFSIERVHIGSDNEHTVIGYILISNPSDLKEWKYDCSLTTHNKLAADFRKTLTN